MLHPLRRLSAEALAAGACACTLNLCMFVLCGIAVQLLPTFLLLHSHVAGAMAFDLWLPRSRLCPHAPSRQLFVLLGQVCFGV
jgi:hypothetical protein